MRVLVTVNNAVGHLLPLAPTLQALVDGGHAVLVACPGGSVDLLDSLGVTTRRFDPGEPVIPPHPVDADREERLRFAVTDRWPAAARGWARELVTEAERWRPDVVIVEPVEHAGRVAAAALGIPWVEHGWGFSLPDDMEPIANDGLSDLYAEFGAVAEPPKLRVDLGPARLQAMDTPAEVIRYRYQPWSPPAPPLPAPGERPRVLVTVGTMQHDTPTRLITAAQAAASLGAEAVVAAGGRDMSGAQWPPRTLFAKWLHMPSELARCHAVVHHGGAGTAYAAIDAGIPAVCLPQLGDQFRNASLLSEAGVCLTADPDSTSEQVQALLARALASDSMRGSVSRLRAENRALPACDTFVETLTDLTGAGQGT